MIQNKDKYSSVILLFDELKKSLDRIKENNLINELDIEFNKVINQSYLENSWFTFEQVSTALNYWSENLTQENIENWLSEYLKIPTNKIKKIGLILAGNIPMVGFHDVLCVLFSGNIPIIKLSSKDFLLIPFILKKWKEKYPNLEYEFVEKLENYDAIIATGSDNTSNYFEYYFKKYPNIIRKNRTSISVLSGDESDDEIKNLAKDIFTYFGLGCRNVTQLFLPKKFTINRLYENFIDFKDVIYHNKYANNYDYHKAIFLLNQDNFWDNNFLLIKESNLLFSPLAVLYIHYYENIKEVENFITDNKGKIQTVVTKINLQTPIDKVPFGYTQKPKLNTYADGVDTLKFLSDLD